MADVVRAACVGAIYSLVLFNEELVVVVVSFVLVLGFVVEERWGCARR